MTGVRWTSKGPYPARPASRARFGTGPGPFGPWSGLDRGPYRRARSRRADLPRNLGRGTRQGPWPQGKLRQGSPPGRWRQAGTWARAPGAELPSRKLAPMCHLGQATSRLPRLRSCIRYPSLSRSSVLTGQRSG